jgi:hypothetical protein
VDTGWSLPIILLCSLYRCCNFQVKGTTLEHFFRLVPISYRFFWFSQVCSYRASGICRTFTELSTYFPRVACSTKRSA